VRPISVLGAFFCGLASKKDHRATKKKYAFAKAPQKFNGASGHFDLEATPNRGGGLTQSCLLSEAPAA
jgi:hypothetical protein